MNFLSEYSNRTHLKSIKWSVENANVEGRRKNNYFSPTNLQKVSVYYYRRKPPRICGKTDLKQQPVF